MTVVPMIAYEDGNTAMDWLIEAFGFIEADRRVSKDGRLTHGELEAGDQIVMLATPTPHYESPKAAGARILSEPEDTPDRRHYRVEDLEGHRWMFEEGGLRL